MSEQNPQPAGKVSAIGSKLIRRARQVALIPAWLAFKFRHAGQPITLTESDQSTAGYQGHEQHLRSVLSTKPGGAFLEIGIGAVPNLDRHRFMIAQNIRYTGCDFDFVADRHRREIRAAGIDDANLHFVTNSRGTYAWPLFEMMRRGEQFDVIYVDGHHTFYVDLPAFALADQLLKPGGYLLADDIEWTLDFVRDHMRRSMGAWYFYGSMYDFDQYSPQQRAMPHMKMIVEELLVRKLGYEKIEEWSRPDWWTLRKPESPARGG